MQKIQEQLYSILKKIGIPNYNDMEYFFDNKPEFFPEGTSIYSENGKYHIVDMDRALITKEKTFDTESDLLYCLLDSYILYEASRTSSQQSGENNELYFTRGAS